MADDIATERRIAGIAVILLSAFLVGMVPNAAKITCLDGADALAVVPSGP